MSCGDLTKWGLPHTNFPFHTTILVLPYRSGVLLIPIIDQIVGGPVTTWPRVVLLFLFLSPHDDRLSYIHCLLPIREWGAVFACPTTGQVVQWGGRRRIAASDIFIMPSMGQQQQQLQFNDILGYASKDIYVAKWPVWPAYGSRVSGRRVGYRPRIWVWSETSILNHASETLLPAQQCACILIIYNLMYITLYIHFHFLYIHSSQYLLHGPAASIHLFRDKFC